MCETSKLTVVVEGEDYLSPVLRKIAGEVKSLESKIKSFNAAWGSGAAVVFANQQAKAQERANQAVQRSLGMNDSTGKQAQDATKHSLIRTNPVLSAMAATGIVTEGDLEWLADVGKSYRGVELPPFVEKREPGRCLDAADELDRKWGYRRVRGFALRPWSTKPVPHAWGTAGSKAIDPTWTRQTGCQYFGIIDYEDEARLDRISRDLHRSYGWEPRRAAS